jgi:putative membrane protein
MSETEVTVVKEKSLSKGLVAGAIGGLVGALARTLAERMFPPRTHGEPEATYMAPEHIAGYPLDTDPGAIASESIRWGFGAAVGAAYGALAEYYPAATAKEGASFGMALEALTQETALPALGLPGKPEDETTRDRAGEVTSHVVYGVTTEFVRHFMRKIL